MASQDVITKIAALPPRQQQLAKKETLQNFADAKKLDPEEARKQLKRRAESKRWDETENAARISRFEIKKRVSALREELESYCQQLDGAPFGITSGDMSPPISLDGGERKYTLELVEELNPIIGPLFKMIDEYAEQHGTHEEVDFNSKLYALKDEASETGFKIGVLAGVILSGASKEVVDRFERGLIFDMKCNNRVAK
jgi:hypothetical protein